MTNTKTSHPGAVQGQESDAVFRREEQKELVLTYLKRMPFYKWAAAFAGISKDTLEDWRKEDSIFSARCEAAKAEAIEHFGKRATPDFILRNTDPETFKEKKEVEVRGDPLVIIKNKT